MSRPENKVEENTFDILESTGTGGAINKTVVVDRRTRIAIGVLKANSGVNSKEYLSEYMCYKLALLLGVPCCPVTFSTDNMSCVSHFVYPEYNFKKDACHIFNKAYFQSKSDKVFQEILAYITQHLKGDCLYGTAQMLVFDILTFQQDRHLHNYGYVMDDAGIPCEMYPLFDNGASLFYDSNIVLYDKSCKTKYGSNEAVVNKIAPVCSSPLFSHLPTKEEIVAAWLDVPNLLYGRNTKSEMVRWLCSRISYTRKLWSKACGTILSENVKKIATPLFKDEAIEVPGDVNFVECLKAFEGCSTLSLMGNLYFNDKPYTLYDCRVVLDDAYSNYPEALSIIKSWFSY